MHRDHLGSEDGPSETTPDPRFYFDSRAHRKAMAYLGYGVAHGEGFVVITGEAGAGKSMLVARLLETIDRFRLDVVSTLALPGDGVDMLRRLAQLIGIASEGTGKTMLVDCIEQHLDAAARAGSRTLLIIDDAEKLGPSALEALAMLSNYRIGGRSPLQIFLFGRSDLRDALARADELEPFRRRVIAAYHLGALGEDEIGPYMLHRRRLMGREGLRPGFAPEAFRALHRHSGGVPRCLNELSDRLMLYAATEQLATVDAITVDAVLIDVGQVTAEREFTNKIFPLRPGQTASVPGQELSGRIAALESRLGEQEEALRGILKLLIDWIEDEPGSRVSRRGAI